MLTIILSFLQGNIARIAIYSVIASAGAFLWFDYQSSKADLIKSEYALSNANSEIIDATKTIEEIVNEYEKLDEEVDKQRRYRQQAERLASKRRRELQSYLHNNNDAVNISILTSCSTPCQGCKATTLKIAKHSSKQDRPAMLPAFVSVEKESKP